MNKRAIFRVEGLVQRAGFRDLVQEHAFKLGITGRVENMPDKTVKIICEGDETPLDDLRQRIYALAAPIIVTDISTRYRPYNGEFTSFDIIRDKDPSKENDERADRAIHLLGETISAIRSVDSRIQVMDSHVVSMDSDLKSMDSNIGGHFDKLDNKYDRFGASLAQVADDIHDAKDLLAGLLRPKSSHR